MIKCVNSCEFRRISWSLCPSVSAPPLTMVSQDNSVACFFDQVLHLQTLVPGDRATFYSYFSIAQLLNPNLLDLNGLPWPTMLVQCWHVGNRYRRRLQVLADNADKARRCRHGFTPWDFRDSFNTKRLKQFMAVGHWPDWWSPVIRKVEITET